MSELHGMPGHLIRRAHQISSAAFTEECGAFDLTSVQFAALHAVARHPGVDATRLSALIAFDRSTIGDVLDRMEGKGWIRRRPDPGDRRAKRIEATEAGAMLLRQVAPAVRRVQERILAPLAPADRDRFMRMLARLAEVHGETVPAASAAAR